MKSDFCECWSFQTNDIERFSDISDPESHDEIDEGFYDDYEVVRLG